MTHHSSAFTVGRDELQSVLKVFQGARSGKEEFQSAWEAGVAPSNLGDVLECPVVGVDTARYFF